MKVTLTEQPVRRSAACPVCHKPVVLNTSSLFPETFNSDDRRTMHLHLVWHTISERTEAILELAEQAERVPHLCDRVAQLQIDRDAARDLAEAHLNTIGEQRRTIVEQRARADRLAGVDVAKESLSNQLRGSQDTVLQRTGRITQLQDELAEALQRVSGLAMELERVEQRAERAEQEQRAPELDVLTTQLEEARGLLATVRAANRDVTERAELAENEVAQRRGESERLRCTMSAARRLLDRP